MLGRLTEPSRAGAIDVSRTVEIVVEKPIDGRACLWYVQILKDRLFFARREQASEILASSVSANRIYDNKHVT